MGVNKTIATIKSVSEFVKAVKDETQCNDCFTLIEIIKDLTGFEPHMWGTGIVGFGRYHYRYQSGHEGESPLVAFSPRSAAIVLYLSGHFENREELLEKLGKHKTDNGCIYIKKLTDIDRETLQKMIVKHIEHLKELYPEKQ